MSVRVIEDDSHFQQELHAAGVRLVVVDFTATWYVYFIQTILYMAKDNCEFI